MAKYRVGTLITGWKEFGEFEADSKEEAIAKAFDEVGCDQVGLCWQCSRDVGELYISDRVEDIECELIEE